MFLNLIEINFTAKIKWCVMVKGLKGVVKVVYGCGKWSRYVVLERGWCGKIRAALIV